MHFFRKWKSLMDFYSHLSIYIFLYKQPGLTCPKFKQLLGLSCQTVSNCDQQFYTEMLKNKQPSGLSCSFPFEVLRIENRLQGPFSTKD